MKELSNKKFNIPLKLLALSASVWSIIIALAVLVSAADVTGIDGFTYKSFFSSISYSVASTTGSVSVSGDTFTIKATGTNASGCSSAVSSTTTLSLTTNQVVTVTYSTTGATVTATGIGEDGYVASGTTITFAITASNGTEVSSSVTITVAAAISDIPEDAAMYYIQGAESTYYYYLDKAIGAAGTSGTIVVYKGGTVYHSDGETTSYTIPSGVKLLIPYSSSDTGIFADSGIPTGDSTPACYCKLAVPSNTTITCEGAIQTSSLVYTAGSRKTGVVDGPYGQIDLGEGAQLVMTSGSYLYCYGYITGKGGVIAESGANVYELLQLTDWRGGTATSTWNSGNYEAFIFSQYYVQNIECYYTIMSGAVSSAVATITASSMTVQQSSAFIGDGGLFVLEDGSYLIRKYDGSTDRISYDVYGNASIDHIEVTLKMGVTGLINQTVSSADHIFPINSNIDIRISSGTTTIAQRIKLLPETSVYIANEAEVIIAEGGAVFIYNNVGDWDEGYVSEDSVSLVAVPYSPTKTGTRTLSNGATITVDGTLTANGGVYITDGAYFDAATSGGSSGSVKYSTASIVRGDVSADTVLLGKGIFVNNVDPVEDNNSLLDEIIQGYKYLTDDTDIAEIVINVDSVGGMLAGVSDTTYNTFSKGTYYGQDNGYWYQYTITAGGDGSISVTGGNGVATGNSSGDVAHVASGGSVTFTADGYDVYLNSVAGENKLTPTDGTYTLTGVTADTTLVLVQQSIGATYYVTITWSQDKIATYTPGTTTYTWSPTDLKYTASTTEGSWNSTTSVMTVTINNTQSTGDVTASFTYAPTIASTMSGDSLTVEAGKSDSRALTITPSGTPTAPTDGTDTIILGVITITLTKGG